jgi:hypothetical protein
MHTILAISGAFGMYFKKIPKDAQYNKFNLLSMSDIQFQRETREAEKLLRIRVKGYKENLNLQWQ